MLTFSVTYGEITCTGAWPADAGTDAYTDLANRTVAAMLNAFESLAHTSARLHAET